MDWAADGGIDAFLAAIRAGTISAETMVRTCLSRIDTQDRAGPALRAMLRITPDLIDMARARDLARQGGAPLTPLHGVPIAIKDNIDLYGMATTSGCAALAGAMPLRNAPVVDALLNAGAVPVGKTNLSEFSFEIRSRSSLGGDTLNPFTPTVTSGGSSGGTAVAVAAGFALAGIGTDTGGSIRVPAAYTGLVGLRPTWGAISTQGVAPLAPSTDTVGVITRLVADAALLFNILAPLHPAHATPPTMAGMRVGVVRQLFGTHPDIVRGMENAIAALCDAAVTLEDFPTLPDALIPAGAHIVDEEFGPAFDTYLRENFEPGSAPASLNELIASGRFLRDYDADLRARALPRDPAVRTAIRARHARLRDTLDTMMTARGFDALLYPPSGVLPDSLDNPKGGWAPELAACTGWPALVVPTGRAGNGLPLSAELLGRAHDEATLFALGTALEARLGPRPVPTLEPA